MSVFVRVLRIFRWVRFGRGREGARSGILWGSRWWRGQDSFG